MFRNNTNTRLLHQTGYILGHVSQQRLILYSRPSFYLFNYLSFYHRRRRRRYCLFGQPYECLDVNNDGLGFCHAWLHIYHYRLL